ncbi:MAG: hypothetical protein JWM59_3791 [Verrucomicrobiales bacterium]|nr:hypothetical protein [Verrucomicrobiales bacterium]
MRAMAGRPAAGYRRRRSRLGANPGRVAEGAIVALTGEGRCRDSQNFLQAAESFRIGRGWSGRWFVCGPGRHGKRLRFSGGMGKQIRPNP